MRCVDEIGELRSPDSVFELSASVEDRRLLRPALLSTAADRDRPACRRARYRRALHVDRGKIEIRLELELHDDDATPSCAVAVI